MKPESPISAQVPDWSREEITQFWDPGPKLLRTIRRYQKAKAQSGLAAGIRRKYWALLHRYWSTVTQCEIHLNTNISGGLRLMHPNGIVIHPNAKIGPNCLIFHQVTLAGAVVLGGHVDVGAGAKILGPLTVGDHALIGANAVVNSNVPSGATAVGIPAKVVSD